MDPPVILAMNAPIELRYVFALTGACQGKYDDHGLGTRQKAVWVFVVATGVEAEGNGVVAAGGGCSCVRDVEAGEEGKEEGACPAGAEDEEVDWCWRDPAEHGVY